MATLGTKYIDSYNYFQFGYTILSQKDQKTTYRRWTTLTVVSGGHVAWSNGSVEYYNPYSWTGLSTYYGPGTYTIAYQDVTVTHQDGQAYTETISGKIATSYSAANWSFSGSATFPAMDSATNITDFEGTKLKGDLDVTFTPKTGYTYKLKICLNGDTTAIDTFDNYTSGTTVRLSSTTISYIQNKIKEKEVTLKATLVSYKGATLVGQKEKTLTVSNTKGLHLRVSGAWKEAIPYVRLNGVWKECVPYVRNNEWKEGI